MGRVLCEPSWHGLSWFWAELSCTQPLLSLLSDRTTDSNHEFQAGCQPGGDKYVSITHSNLNFFPQIDCPAPMWQRTILEPVAIIDL